MIAQSKNFVNQNCTFLIYLHKSYFSYYIKWNGSM